MSYFTDMDCYLFGQATHYDIYRKMGAHLMVKDGEKGVCFTVWAPHAEKVFVIGDFNGWNEWAHEMHRVEPTSMGVYELFIPGVQQVTVYQSNHEGQLIDWIQEAYFQGYEGIIMNPGA